METEDCKKYSMIKGDSEDGPFAFPWVEIYNGNTFTYTHFDYELAAVLYNIGKSIFSSKFHQQMAYELELCVSSQSYPP